MGILDGLLGRSRKATATAGHPLLEHVPAVLGDEILAARDLAATLVPALEYADQYLRDQIATIPGPLQVSSSSRAADPLMSRLFPGAEDLRAGLGRSLEVKDSIVPLAVAGHPLSYGLLGTRFKRDSEVNVDNPIFADHTIKALTDSEARSRDALRIAGLRRIIKNFDQHLAKLREKQQLLRIEWNIENLPAVPVPGNGGEFVRASTELTPDNLSRGLAAWLRRPAEALRLEAGAAKIPGRSPDGEKLGHYELPVMHCADRRQWIVCLVAFPTYEAAEALKAESRTHRYIFI